MSLRKRHRQHPKTIKEAEVSNKLTSQPSSNYYILELPPIALGKISKSPGVSVGLRKGTRNDRAVFNRLLLVPMTNRNTNDQAVLLTQQDSSIQRATIKKNKLLKEKSDKFKWRREEKFKQAEKRRKIKEPEREEKIKGFKTTEQQRKEFRSTMKPPKRRIGRGGFA